MAKTNQQILDRATDTSIANHILGNSTGESLFQKHQINDRFSGAREHGHAGELMGDTMDKLSLRRRQWKVIVTKSMELIE